MRKWMQSLGLIYFKRRREPDIDRKKRLFLSLSGYWFFFFYHSLAAGDISQAATWLWGWESWAHVVFPGWPCSQKPCLWESRGVSHGDHSGTKEKHTANEAALNHSEMSFFADEISTCECKYNWAHSKARPF